MTSQIDLLLSHSWDEVAFTTYALSLAFFESVVVDAMMRSKTRKAYILSDSFGIRSALSETGIRDVGRTYEVEPVHVQGGVFHPKLTTLSAEDDCHLLVGSGNLTFGGHGINLEVLDHLHGSFAADALLDAAEFFEKLAASPRTIHCASDRCEQQAARLRRAIEGRSRNGDIRLIHSIEGSIASRISSFVDELGGARRLVAAAPFWDGGAAIDRLATSIGLSEVFVHAHPGGVVEGKIGRTWPTSARIPVQAVALDAIRNDSRLLHGKMFEIMCRKGRLLVTGSANATGAALDVNHNVEACVVRVQRSRKLGWNYVKTDPPEVPAPVDAVEETGAEPGVLQAILEGSVLTGRIIAPKMIGIIELSRNELGRDERLGACTLDTGGRFQLDVPDLEAIAVRQGRLIVKAQATNGTSAEGFVTQLVFREVTDRIGQIGAKLFSIISGTETPRDVLAMLTWFCDNPKLLKRETAAAGGDYGSQAGACPAPVSISLSELFAGEEQEGGRASGHGGGTSLQRILNLLRDAFRKKTGTHDRPEVADGPDFDDDSENGQQTDTSLRTRQSNDKDSTPKMLAALNDVLDVWLSSSQNEELALTSFDLARYICETARPSPFLARQVLDRVLTAVQKVQVPENRVSEIAGAVLLLLRENASKVTLRAARSRLMKLGWPMDAPGPVPPENGFGSVIQMELPLEELWTRVTGVRTAHELITAFLHEYESGRQGDYQRELGEIAGEAWRTMEAALLSERERRNILTVQGHQRACPKCSTVLPVIQEQVFRQTGIAITKGCCQKVLICREGPNA